VKMTIYKRRKTGQLLALPAILCLTGCGVDCSGFDDVASNRTGPEIGRIVVSVDGSGSMMGFSTVADSSFHQLLEELDTALGVSSSLGYAKSTITVKRIGREGSNGKRLSSTSISSVLAARRPEFYDEQKGKWPKVSSAVEQFVSKDNTSVDILVSDLEPDDASIKQILSAIKPKLEFQQNNGGWFSNQQNRYPGNELAIIGMRSQFSGVVFPTVQGNFQSFRYEGLRPIYILVLGPVDKVEKVITKLEANKMIGANMQISRFASHPDSGKTIFINQDKSILSPANCLQPVFSISQGLAGKLKLQTPKHWLLAQRMRGCQASQVDIKFTSDVVPGLMSQRYTDKSLFTSPSLSIKAVELSGAGATVATRFSLSDNSINMIDLSSDTSKMDEFMWSSWNTSGSRPDGSKTQRLLQLVQSIRAETDQFAMSTSGKRYSPIRMCAAVKG
jgi:hypothetical protein